MGKNFKRLLEIRLPPGRSAFLWGPRKVGKSFWIRHHLPDARLIDLLKTDEFAEYASRPCLLRERMAIADGIVVIDEIQKLPPLLDEVHWLIENRGISFLLTGSSARKLRRQGANLLGGRAWRKVMLPLSSQEVPGFDLERAMVSGMLPPHYLSPDPIEDLRAYIADYLKEEVAQEAEIQNIPAFSEFLRVAAFTSSELLNYANIAREVGVSAKVIRTYFEILELTYLGFRLEPWKKSKSRRMIQAEKFYLFDVGVTNFLLRRQPVVGSPEFGKAFEQFILMELRAWQAYRQPDLPLTFWRTSTGQEVDFLLGDKVLALEIKASGRVHEHDTRGLRALREDGPVKHAVLVCLEREPRIVDGDIYVLPWQYFLEKLWNDGFQ